MELNLLLLLGTQMDLNHSSEALVRASNLVKLADVIGALTLEVLKGTSRAFDEKIHAARPHKGQIASAERLRKLLENPKSTLAQSHYNCNQVQDCYSLRCMPQIHGVVGDTVDFVRTILTTELNSATDNPMIFAATKERYFIDED